MAAYYHRHWRPRERKLLFSLFLGLTLSQCLWNWHIIFQDHAIFVTQPDDAVSTELVNSATRPLVEVATITTRQPAKQYNNNNRLHLRFDWTNLDRLSPLAQRIANHQSNCTIPMANFRFRNRFGLGSDLHVYSQAICNVLEVGDIRVRTSFPWIWLDVDTCASVADQTTTTSAMTCYFPDSELLCPNDHHLTAQQESAIYNMTRGRGKIKNACPRIRASYSVSDIRAATTEFLFTRVSHAVQHEAERQLQHVFGVFKNNDEAAAVVVVVPKNLITVHIRWGDKADEMKLLPITDYVEGVERILTQRRQSEILPLSSTDDDDDVNIFLATEDPHALQEFLEAAPSTWKIYIDQYFREMLSHRRSSYNGSPLMSQDLKGRPGLVALGSLLVAMEANDFVLTTASNWSRLMNELRRNVLNPRCRNCTRLVDLKHGEW